ncbi:Thioredoxin M4 [Cardamine amara subsp. amara]|uniref:Thioredoxin M4 n=1 Tax=Cardamine amara subsp. amara TaxID=228776 RepID=A0ABD0ZKW1_CARAN
MEQIRVSNQLVVMVTCMVCLGFSVGMSSETDPVIKTYVSSSLPSNDDLVYPGISKWETLVIESRVPSMVMFTELKRCITVGPYCRGLVTTMEKLSKDFNGRFKFYSVETDEEPGIAHSYHVDTSPESRPLLSSKPET